VVGRPQEATTSLRLYSATLYMVLAFCACASHGPQRLQENPKAAQGPLVPQENPKAPLALTAEPIRRSVPFGEPVDLRLTLENAGSKNVFARRALALKQTLWPEVIGRGLGKVCRRG
jgi:hypothetical protein